MPHPQPGRFVSLLANDSIEREKGDTHKYGVQLFPHALPGFFS
jgi:hypothetical protein